MASFRYQLSLVTSEGRMPDFIATSRRSSFLLDIKHSREWWLLPPRGGGWGGVNLPDPHIRFCNIPHWLLNCSSFFPLQTLWSMWSILVGVLMCYQLILYWHRLRSKTKVTMLCIRHRQTRCTSWDPFDLLNYRAMFWKNKTGNQF